MKRHRRLVTALLLVLLAGLLGTNLSELASKALGGYLELAPDKAGKVLPMLVPLIGIRLERRRGVARDFMASLYAVAHLVAADTSTLDEEQVIGGFLSRLSAGQELGGLSSCLQLPISRTNFTPELALIGDVAVNKVWRLEGRRKRGTVRQWRRVAKMIG